MSYIFTFKQLADEVVASRKRIREADPDAYSGAVTDTACYAVARRRNMKATDVLRAYRIYHPSNGKPLPLRWIKVRKPSKAAKAVA